MERVDLRTLLEKVEGRPEFYGCADALRRANEGDLWATPLYRLPARWDRQRYANAYIDVTPDGYHPAVGDPTPGTVLRLPADPRWTGEGLRAFLEGPVMRRLHGDLLSNRAEKRARAFDAFMEESLKVPKARVKGPAAFLRPWLSRNLDRVYTLHHTAITCDDLDRLFELYPETVQHTTGTPTIIPGLWRLLAMFAVYNTPRIAAGASTVG